jgi:hypothetical protein
MPARVFPGLPGEWPRAMGGLSDPVLMAARQTTRNGRCALKISTARKGPVRSMASACSPHDLSLIDVAAKAAEREIDPACQTARVTVRDVSAMLAYRLDPGEHVRRREAGMVAVTRLDWLHAMLGLPAGIPVRLNALSSCSQQIVEDLPPGCVQLSGKSVVRQLIRPLRVDLAVVTAESSDWQAGLHKAGAFSGYCTRILAIAGMPGKMPEACTEAARYGVGLVVDADSSPATAVPALRFKPSAHTAAGWRFAEQVYEEIAGHPDLI